jgi:hypothetical protein
VHGNIVKNLAKSLLLPSVFASLSCALIFNLHRLELLEVP